MKLEGNPLTDRPGEATGVFMGPRLGCGVAGPDLDKEKAFINAAMSPLIGKAPPRYANVAPGGFRAASRVPRGVDEGFMVDMLDGTALSETMRGGGDLEEKGLVGLTSGEGSSSGEVGGEGDSSGDSGVSPKSVMVMGGRRTSAVPSCAGGGVLW